MKLIVGLGNPGKNYQNTRHNVGFIVVDEFLKQHTCYIRTKEGDSVSYQVNNSSCPFLLIKPQTYMNLSGKAVIFFMKKYGITSNNILIILDDIYLSEGVLRLRMRGSHGGHNGLRNIISCCGTENIKRLKIGVGYEKNNDLNSFLLTPMTQESYKNVFQHQNDINKIITNFINEKN